SRNRRSNVWPPAKTHRTKQFLDLKIQHPLGRLGSPGARLIRHPCVSSALNPPGLFCWLSRDSYQGLTAPVALPPAEPCVALPTAENSHHSPCGSRSVRRRNHI